MAVKGLGAMFPGHRVGDRRAEEAGKTCTGPNMVNTGNRECPSTVMVMPV